MRLPLLDAPIPTPSRGGPPAHWRFGITEALCLAAVVLIFLLALALDRVRKD